MWGGATAANQCEGAYDADGRSLANVDVVPIGEDRLSIITGRRKMLDFEDGYFYPAKESIDMYPSLQGRYCSLVKWALRPIVSIAWSRIFPKGMRLSQMKLGLPLRGSLQRMSQVWH